MCLFCYKVIYINIIMNINIEPPTDKVKYSIDEIVDIDKILNNIIDFIQFSDKPEIIDLEKRDDTAYFHLIMERYEELPMSIIRLLMERENRSENVEKLLDMITLLSKLKNGEGDINEEFEKFSENLNEEYVYPEFGGKEKFEEKMNNAKN